MLVIGEKINASNRAVAKAIAKRDEEYIANLTRLGIKAEQVFFDPLVLPIAVDANQGLSTLRTIERVKSRYPTARTVMGLSNTSYGLPGRPLTNRAFLLMAAYAGLDAVIVDPSRCQSNEPHQDG